MKQEKNVSPQKEGFFNADLEINFGEKKAFVSLGKVAQQANGSALVKMGETVVLATAVMSKEPKKDLGFFPLMVEYEENYWAAGKIRNSRFMKRKGKPTDEAILTSRLIDRSIRPLFPEGMQNEVQIVISVLSFDFENDPRSLAVLGASIALEVSGIPFEGPLCVTHLGKKEELILAPTIKEQEEGALDMFITGVGENIVMVEAGAKELTEEEMISALDLAQEKNKEMAKDIQNLCAKFKKERTEIPLKVMDVELKKSLQKKYSDQFQELFNNYKDKLDYEATVRNLEKEIILKEEADGNGEQTEDIKAALYSIQKETIQKNVLENKKRLGGRGMDEVRPLNIEISVLPRVHGSALFTRGETQGLTVTTLGSPGNELYLDGMGDSLGAKKRYLHFYSFPPYSVGECFPMRGPGRREIGHGALGEKAIASMIPPKEEFPYSIVMQTEIMASDGSTSMASVCGSTLALMDAGVPMKKPVAGVAMGLVIDKEKKNFQVLTDLCANEDFAGHMDFKVAGTKDGITALQMDIKTKGLSLEILKEALAKAQKGRLFILDKMLEVIAEPKKEMSLYAPRVTKLSVNPEKIGTIIGPGGKMINSIIEQTGAQIDIEDDGSVFVTSQDKEGMEKAVSMINSLVKEPKVGEEYIGTIVEMKDFGVMVEFLPRRKGLIHVSRLNNGQRIERISDVARIGEKVKIKIEEVDHMGRYNLTLIEKIK
jgi:polyribonucleotide nucleotidyltransferase